MTLDRYDPDVQPAAADWLGLAEEQRLALVLAHHSDPGAPLPNVRLHAAIHVVVENQVALGDPAGVAETLQRLQLEGLSRHDAIHLIGTAVSDMLLDATARGADRATVVRHYANRLTALTGRNLVDRDDDDREP
jgi:hypothetical protein